MRLAGALMLPAMLLASCSDELDTPDNGTTGPKPGYITISLRDKAPGTRAEEADVDTLNENLISTAYVCLYANGADDNAVPVVAQSFDLNANTTGTVEIRLRREILNALFPGNSTSCRAYVVANLPAESTLPGQLTINNLRNIAVEADFATYNPQPSFVMDGDNSLTLTGDISTPSQCTVTGQVDLQRAASKIRLGVKVADSVTANGETWVPQTDSGMSVLISNGVRKAKVQPDAKPGADDAYYSTATNAADETHRARTLADKGESEEYRYQLDRPFYTFPNSWSGNDDNMTYMVLTVPFKKQNEETYRTCYYTVPVVRDNSIGRNISYLVNININILGSFNPDEPLLLEDLSYRAIEWSSESMDVAIQDYRYLVLDQTEYVVNNLDSINIPFYSSHETVVKSIKFIYQRYNTNMYGISKDIVITKAQNDASESTLDGSKEKVYNCDIDNSINKTTNARTVKFKHELVVWAPYDSQGRAVSLSGTGTSIDDMSYPEDIDANIESIVKYVKTNTPAYSQFDIEITIVHEDLIDDANTPFQQTIRIKQYPGLYIETDPNVYIEANGMPLGTAAFGNVYINGNTNTNTSYAGTNDHFTPNGLIANGTNRNPNMYIINVTRLASNRYRIGDPRVTTIDNLNFGNNWTNAPALFDGESNRRLRYYYPTNGTDTTKMTIAPKFRVASSYGVSFNMNKTTAQRRCASYQEENCPAGRWRLPTYAEMEYIISLTNAHMIPILFSPNVDYWNAHGRSTATLNSKGELSIPVNGSRYNGAVRCVYDEWYWESVDPKIKTNGTVTWNYSGKTYTNVKYDFTWGDKAR